jgi:quinol monooxygenase YgiN
MTPEVTNARPDRRLIGDYRACCGRSLAVVSRCGLVKASPSILASNAEHREGGAVSELWGIARVKFHAGKVEEFKNLSAQLMEIARTKDTGTLQYDIYLNDDESEGVVLERYRDSEALIEHGANQGDLAEAIFATGTFVGEVLGEASADLKAKLADGPVRVFTPHLSM